MTVEEFHVLQCSIDELTQEIHARPTWADLDYRVNSIPSVHELNEQIRCLWTAFNEVSDKFQCLLRYLEENYGITVDVQDLL